MHIDYFNYGEIYDQRQLMSNLKGSHARPCWLLNVQLNVWTETVEKMVSEYSFYGEKLYTVTLIQWFIMFFKFTWATQSACLEFRRETPKIPGGKNEIPSS